MQHEIDRRLLIGGAGALGVGAIWRRRDVGARAGGKARDISGEG